MAALLGVGLLGTAGAGTITVRSGDTLWDLARDSGLTVDALKAANGRSGDTIYAGESLTIPGSTTTASGSAASEVAYVVQPGDTVIAIARRQGTSAAGVIERNGLSAGGAIRAGQVLALPTTVRSAPSVAAPSTGTVGSSAAQHRAQLANRNVPSKAEVRAIIADTARQYGVPSSLALAVAYQESGFQQEVVSSVGAIGAMQVLPRTGRNLERVAGRPLDLLDARDNVLAGVLLLRQLTRSEGSVEATLAGYYQGVGSIARQGILPQTEQYIANIGILRQRFADG